MKLKILPPTLRKNNRYLALDIKTDNVSLSKDELVSIIWEGCIHYCGECGTSDFNLWVMRFYDLDKVNHYNYKAIVRCQRDYVDNVRASLSLINKYNGRRIAITTVGLSGTVKSCERFI